MRYLRFLAAGLAMTLLPACVTLPFAVRTPSRLPVEIVDQGSGEIHNVRAMENGERLVVSGTVWTIHVKGPTHVDIRLVTADGRILDERHEDIERGRSTTAHDCRHSFIASFPVALVKRASRVVVVYHDAMHR